MRALLLMRNSAILERENKFIFINKEIWILIQTEKFS